MTKEIKISTLILIILVGFCCAVVYHYFLGLYLEKGYPYNTFLFQPSDRFSDFYRTLSYNKDLSPYITTNKILEFPFLNLTGYAFSFIPGGYALKIFIGLVSVFMVIACMYSLRINYRNTNWTNVFIMSFLTYPFLYDIDRGNFDGIIFIILTIFIYFFMKKRYLIAALILSFAIAMKPFPALFLLLFVPEKKFKEIAITVLSTLFLSITPLLAFKGGFRANLSTVLLIPSLPDVNSVGGYFTANNFNYHNVSLFTIVKFHLIETGTIQNINMALYSNYYNKGVILAFLPIGFYVVFIEKELWRRVTLLTISMIIFPQLSADYRLIYMFVPLFLFLINEKQPIFDLIYTILFGLLLIPKSYYYYPNTITDSGYRDFTISDPVNVYIMVIILSTIMISGLIKIKSFKLFKKYQIPETPESSSLSKVQEMIDMD